MRSRRRIGIVVALVGCLALGGFALATGASSRTGPVPAGTGVPLGAIASATASRTLPQTATALATIQAGHAAFDATEAANFAPARPHNAPDPRNAPTPPTSCPRGGSATPLIVRDPRVEQHGIVIAIASQASLSVGQESYTLSSGASRDNAQQGVIVVAHFVADPCAHPEQQTATRLYPTPAQHGTVTITGVQGAVVTFSQADGMSGTFEVTTGQYNVP